MSSLTVNTLQSQKRDGARTVISAVGCLHGNCKGSVYRANTRGENISMQHSFVEWTEYLNTVYPLDEELHLMSDSFWKCIFLQRSLSQIYFSDLWWTSFIVVYLQCVYYSDCQFHSGSDSHHLFSSSHQYHCHQNHRCHHQNNNFCSGHHHHWCHCSNHHHHHFHHWHYCNICCSISHH